MRTSLMSCKLTVVALFFLGISCSQSMPDMEPLGEFETQKDDLSPVRYWDRDLVSRIDRCPNTQARVYPAIEPIYVNGRPVGVW
jgi:hypothetical protein